MFCAGAFVAPVTAPSSRSKSEGVAVPQSTGGHLGKLYRRTDKREQAQEHLATATTMYRDMGMTYWLEQAETEMRGIG